MSLLKKLLSGNESFRNTYLKYASKLPPTPRKEFAILTCTDTRLNPIRIFHINVGDAEILRNAGNQITDDTIRSLSTAITNGVNEIVILGHTDCSLTKVSAQQVIRTLRNLGAALNLTSFITSNEWLGMFSDEEINVRDQVVKLRSSPIIPANVPIHGLLFNVTTGTVKVVVNGYKPLEMGKGISSQSKMPSLNMPHMNMPETFPGSLLSSLKSKSIMRKKPKELKE